jgi:hypothetical protein
MSGSFPPNEVFEREATSRRQSTTPNQKIGWRMMKWNMLNTTKALESAARAGSLALVVETSSDA